MTAQEHLTAVDAAIQKIVAGGAIQRYMLRGRDISLCSLSELFAIRRGLQVEVVEEVQGGSVILSRFQEPTL